MVTSMKIGLVLGLLLILGGSDIASAQRSNYSRPPAPGRWVLLGQAQVNGRTDQVRACWGPGPGRFKGFQMRMQRAPMESKRAVFHTATAAIEEPNTPQQTPAGGQMRAIDLRGDERNIDSVEFFYS